jgi:hypothetical protein
MVGKSYSKLKNKSIRGTHGQIGNIVYYPEEKSKQKYGWLVKSVNLRKLIRINQFVIYLFVYDAVLN